jgi:hypothetical protein
MPKSLGFDVAAGVQFLCGGVRGICRDGLRRSDMGAEHRPTVAQSMQGSVRIRRRSISAATPLAVIESRLPGRNAIPRRTNRPTLADNPALG